MGSFYRLTPFVWIRYLIVVPRLQITTPPTVSRKRWSALSLGIGNTYRNVNIRSLAHDFCRPNRRFVCQIPAKISDRDHSPFPVQQKSQDLLPGTESSEGHSP